MKFGVRECANIVFRAKTPTNIGKYKFKAGQPVLYIDTATTSSVEQATTTVSDNTQSNDEIVDNNSSNNLIEVIPGVWGTLDEEASTDGKLVYTTDDGVEYTIDTIS